MSDEQAEQLNRYWYERGEEESAQRIAELEEWVNDLHSGMYINCVYCGHRYGPNPGTPVAMANVLKAHIEICPKHPMSAMKRERDEALAALRIERLRNGGSAGPNWQPSSWYRGYEERINPDGHLETRPIGEARSVNPQESEPAS